MQGDRKQLQPHQVKMGQSFSSYCNNISFLFASGNFRWGLSLLEAIDKIRGSALFNVCTLSLSHKPLFTFWKPKRQKEVTGGVIPVLCCHSALHPCTFCHWHDCKIPHLKLWHYIMHSLWLNLFLFPGDFFFPSFSYFSSSRSLDTYCLDLLQCQYPTLN